ncbi:30S ribosomal protein S20 [Sulfidibacter corallicola]|uniref:Small ribosomal subunit protein bS20 n=1 Tax=Sulfidibacter corallicola TaxID=2818388 RepID=A0A8A4TRR9_SULCO|nr:30S ribosomal protein S20 [Sulfidibacter corallicola]QTD52213.1 30S ribosomal protein S20 [Sulfidibacter corallicola]
MANHKSAAKKAKQDIARRARNRAGKSRLRTELKKIRKLIQEGSSEAVTKLPAMYSLIDRSAKKGFIHQNAADRLKARLASHMPAAQ